MICKFCGTESTDKRCPNCGMHMNDQVSAVPPMPPKVNVAPTVKEKPAPKVKAKPVRRSTISFGKIFWPAVALLLPIAYLIFDAYAIVAGELLQGNALGELMALLANPSYESIPLGELAGSVIGNETAVVEVISPYLLMSDMLSGAGAGELEFLLPVGLVALISVCSAVSGILLIVTGGRVLRSRLLTDGILLFGSAASVAPLLGSFALRLYYVLKFDGATAATKMNAVMPTLEWLLIMIFLLCTLLPAMSTLRRVAAQDGGLDAYVPLTFAAAKKCSFGALKILTGVCLLLTLVPALLYLVLQTLSVGAPLQLVREKGIDAFSAFGEALKNMKAGEDPTALATLGEAVSSMAVTVLVLVLLVLTVLVLAKALRVLLVSEDVLRHTKGKKKLLRAAHADGRALLTAPFAVMGCCYAVLTVLMLFASPVALHLDFDSIYDTLGVTYVTAIYAKSLCSLTTAFGAIAALGLLLWRACANFGAAALFRVGKG